MNRSHLALSAAMILVLSAPTMNAYADDFEDGSILLRARALGVLPADSHNSVRLNNSYIGGQVDANDVAIPELDLTYFFTKNIAVEAIAGTTRNAVTAKNMNGVANIELGTTRILPPTITAQWHFDGLPTSIDFLHPYVGAGLNYTFFYDTLGASSLGSHNFILDNTLGYAVQAGFDVHITGAWYANVDVKKLFITTNAHFLDEAVKSPVELDPWLVGAGIGYRF